MSRKKQIDFIKSKIMEDNMLSILDIFSFLFEYGVLFKLLYDNNTKLISSLSITYATDLIYKKYANELVEIIRVIYPNIKHTGSYKMMGHLAITYHYYIS